MAPSRLALTICGVLAWWVVPAAAGAATPHFGETIVLRAPSTLSAGEPAVAVSGSGGIVSAWDQQFSRRAFGIVIRRGTTSGRFAAAERVTASGFQPAVAAGRGGGAAVIWETQQRRGTRRVQVAVAAGRRRFGRPQTLATVRANVTSQQVIATGGRFVAIWWQGIPATGRHAVRYAVSAADHFGATRTLAPDTGPITGVSAAAAPDGTVCGITARRQIMDLNMTAILTRHVSPPYRLVVVIDLEDVFESLVDFVVYGK